MDEQYKISVKQFEFLKVEYENIQTNIRRYSDREWAVPGIFIASLVTTIGFIITNATEVKRYTFIIGFFLLCLSIGNIFYLLFTHDRLTDQRKKLSNLQYVLTQNGYINSLSFPYLIVPPNKKNQFSEFTHGLWDHVFVFIVSGVFLGFVGIYILFSI